MLLVDVLSTTCTKLPFNYPTCREHSVFNIFVIYSRYLSSRPVLFTRLLFLYVRLRWTRIYYKLFVLLNQKGCVSLSWVISSSSSIHHSVSPSSVCPSPSSVCYSSFTRNNFFYFYLLDYDSRNCLLLLLTVTMSNGRWDPCNNSH